MPTRARAYTNRIKTHEFSFQKLADYRSWRTAGRRAVRQCLYRGDFLLWIAGNHLGVLPVYDELGAAAEQTTIVQFDAHLDIHHFADCSSELSHGNFLRHVAGRLPRIINIGHRELLLHPTEIQEFYADVFPADTLVVDPEAALTRVREIRDTAERVFVEIDCDVLDAAFFPAASQPVPFGLSPALLLRFLNAVWSPRVVGVSISEFNPSRDENDRSLALLVWLLEYVFLNRHEDRTSAIRSTKGRRLKP